MPTTRFATLEDLPGILEVLNHEILNGVAHFGIDPQTLEEVQRDFSVSDRYPWVVAVEEEEVLGFVRANPWKSRGGYNRTCEVGVYVRPQAQGKGLGRLLYAFLIPELKRLGFHTLLGGVALPNPASIRLHESFGFKYVGTLPQVGWKKETWHDVGYWALVLNDHH